MKFNIGELEIAPSSSAAERESDEEFLELCDEEEAAFVPMDDPS